MSTTPAADSSRPNGSARRKQRKQVEPKPDHAATGPVHTHAAGQDWEKWCHQPNNRESKTTYLELLPFSHKKTSPFAWFLPESGPWLASLELLNLLHKVTKKDALAEKATTLQDRLVSWLAGASSRSQKENFVLEAITWAAISPALAPLVQQHQWQGLIDVLERLATPIDRPSAVEEPLRFNLLAELGWWLAVLYPEVPQWQVLATSGRESMSHAICELTDGEGLMSTRHWPLTRPLLACWTRSAAIARDMQQPLLHVEAETQLMWFVRQALLLTRPDGSQVLDQRDSGPWNRAAFRAALDLVQDPLNLSIAESLLPRGSKMVHKIEAKLESRTERNKKLPRRASNVSEWAEGAVLRSEWGSYGVLFALTFGDKQVSSELVVGGHVMWSGLSTPQLAIDGQPMPVREIRVVCVFDDKDVDYVELELDYGSGWRLQRQLMLATTDDFLLAADAVLGRSAAQIEYQTAIPLSAEVQFVPANDSREGRLISKQRRTAHVLPLSMPEWRSEPFHGELVERDGQLHLRQSAHASNLFCPLFVDLRKKRGQLPLTWRKLTVAENRIAQPIDIAAGYRVQIGAEQWLVYRSLTGKANRTVLGQHLLHEFVVGRFNSDGDCDILLQIESADE